MFSTLVERVVVLFQQLLKMTSPKLLTFQYLLNPCCLVLQLIHCCSHKESCMYNKEQTLCC
jgi:hypothetical protein